MANKDNKTQEEVKDETMNTEDPQMDVQEEQSATEESAGNGSDEVQQMKDKYLRLFSDFENYKKRTARELF